MSFLESLHNRANEETFFLLHFSSQNVRHPPLSPFSVFSNRDAAGSLFFVSDPSEMPKPAFFSSFFLVRQHFFGDQQRRCLAFGSVKMHSPGWVPKDRFSNCWHGCPCGYRLIRVVPQNLTAAGCPPHPRFLVCGFASRFIEVPCCVTPRITSPHPRCTRQSLPGTGSGSARQPGRHWSLLPDASPRLWGESPRRPNPLCAGGRCCLPANNRQPTEIDGKRVGGRIRTSLAVSYRFFFASLVFSIFKNYLIILFYINL